MLRTAFTAAAISTVVATGVGFVGLAAAAAPAEAGIGAVLADTAGHVFEGIGHAPEIFEAVGNTFS